jgi:hypothetical protein
MKELCSALRDYSFLQPHCKLKLINRKHSIFCQSFLRVPGKDSENAHLQYGLEEMRDILENRDTIIVALSLKLRISWSFGSRITETRSRLFEQKREIIERYSNFLRENHKTHKNLVSSLEKEIELQARYTKHEWNSDRSYLHD